MFDFSARGLAAQSRSIAHRLATLDRLARGIAENLPLGLPGVIAAPIAEVRNTATQIASGTTYGVDATNLAADRRTHFSFHGADWQVLGSSFSLVANTFHQGNGSDPGNGHAGERSGTVRFATHAEKFEINAVNGSGFRVRVNGKYLKTGMYGVSAINGDGAALRCFTLDLAGTELAGAGLKLVEVQGDVNMRFGGARVPMGHTVFAWPQSFPLKAALHGDSMVTGVSETGADYRTALHGQMPHIVQMLTGIPDIRANNIGGVGFTSDSSGTRSDFIEQVAVDFAGQKFDLVWELGGRNDGATYGSQAAYQAVVQSWIGGVLADNPDAVIVMTGPLSMQNSEAYASSVPNAAIQNAKKAACAAYPRNCAFIETIGNAVRTTDPWVFGTGKQGATTGNGNADLVRGNDDTHPTVFGHQYLGARLVSETARVLPLLASRIRDGVAAGVNDLDLV